MGGGTPFPIGVVIGLFTVCIFVYLVWWSLARQRDKALKKYAVPFALFAISSGVILAANYQGRIRHNSVLSGQLTLAGVVILGVGGSLIALWGRQSKHRSPK